jgi:predicted sulfurtransferase
MFKFKELTFLASLFIVGMLLLAACGAEEPTLATVEEAIDTQATVEAAETAASVEAEEAAQATLEAADSASAAESEEEMAEESGVTNTESSSENQVPISKSEVPRISAEELKERLDNGEEIVVVDSRGKSSYDIMHIAGAISVPSVNVESPLDEMALDQEIVLYCA